MPTMRTIARMYDTYAVASQVIHELQEAGIPQSDLSLVANADAHGRYTAEHGTRTTSDVTGGGTHPADPAEPDDTNAEAGAKRGLVGGGVAGGIIGLLTGIGAMAIPGVGPVVAAGWLITTLAGAGAGAAIGAAGGGLLGSLTHAGVPEEEARVYTEGVRRGGSLVTVRVPEDSPNIARIEAIMDRSQPLGWQARRDSWGSDWETTYSGPARDTVEPIGVDDPTRRSTL
jgi:hypothetical protein